MEVFKQIAGLNDPLDYSEYLRSCASTGREPFDIVSYAGMCGTVLMARKLYPDADITAAVLKFMQKDPDEIWVAQAEEPSRGLGDTVAKITKAVGIDKLASAYTKMTGKPCGCGERQEALNKLFPYGEK